MSDESLLSWSETYEQLSRRPERPDPLAWDALERRIRAWTADDEVVGETCTTVWSTLNLARGGASFEGYVHGRFIEIATSPGAGAMNCAPTGPERGSQAVGGGETEAGTERAQRLSACLEELRARNPRHHAVIALLYEDRATPEEAADVLGVDVWTVRMLVARARQALAQCLERAERKRETRADSRAGRSGRKLGPRRQGQPPRRRGT